MKKGDVTVFIAVLAITICAVFIAVAPKANDGEVRTETTYTSSTERESLSNIETIETIATTATTDNATTNTTEDASVTEASKNTVTSNTTVTSTTTESTTAKSTTAQSTTTQKYTYITEATTKVTTTKSTGTMTDEDYLATVIYKEAGADYVSDAARQYVAEVVLNRVASNKYPNTIYEVLTQYRQYGNFSNTGVPRLTRGSEAVERAYRIAASVLDGKRDVPSNVIYQAEFPQGSGVWKYIDGIYFCYE